MAAGALGFGELTASHFLLPAMGEHHPYVATSADHPLLLLLADIAAEHGVLIDFHFDVAPQDMALPERLRNPANPAFLRENLTAFERFLSHNHGAKIVWSHAGSDPGGQRTVPLMRTLLDRHPNLYMSIRLLRRLPHPTVPLGPKGNLKKPWLKLLIDFRSRFMLRTDNFYQAREPVVRRGSNQALELARELLSLLPPELANAIAYENAKRIYNLKP